LITVTLVASSLPSLSWGEVLGRLALAAAPRVGQEGDRRTLELTVDLPREEQARQLVSRVAEVDHVLEVRWAD